MSKKELVLKILEELYENSKLLSSGDLGITEELWNEVVQILDNDNMIFGINIRKVGLNNAIAILGRETAKITISGIEYLEQNKK